MIWSGAHAENVRGGGAFPTGHGESTTKATLGRLAHSHIEKGEIANEAAGKALRHICIGMGIQR